MNKVLLIAYVLVALIAFGYFATRLKPRDAEAATFSVLQSDLDGRPLLALIDMGLRNFHGKEKVPFFLSISTPLINTNSEGMPTRADSEDLNAWEDAVEARLRPQGKYVFVGRVTWNGNRELLYYVDGQQWASGAIKSLSEAHSTRPFAFICERDEAWQHARIWLDRK